jgi:hypothetical protein
MIAAKAASFAIIGGQIFTTGLTIVQPNTPQSSSMTSKFGVSKPDASPGDGPHDAAGLAPSIEVQVIGLLSVLR